MLRFKERNALIISNLDIISKIKDDLNEISKLLNQIIFKLSAWQFHENYQDGTIYEGTVEDRRYVDIRIKKIQSLVDKIEAYKFDVSNIILSDYAKYQANLNACKVNALFISNCLQQIYDMRHEGKTEEDNITIIKLVTKLFKQVRSVIMVIKYFVRSFNKISDKKLKFGIIFKPVKR